MMLTVVTFNYCASIAAALAMDRHHQRVFARRACARDAVALRLLGGALSLCAFVSAILSRSASIGVVDFIIAASIGALLSAVSLALAPRFATAVAGAAATVALLASISTLA
jgi:hypothetical protein